jgi:staphylococcal nuclease domain-containing protein 1
MEENEEEKKIEEDTIIERKIDYHNVLVVEVTPELHLYAQLVEQGPKLVELMEKIRQEFTANPPLPGSFTPKRGELCAAKFTEDRQWYRARVDRICGSDISVFYVDYGNREVVDVTQCAALPSSFATDKYYAQEYALACVQLPNDVGVL